ncbi:MAG: 6-phosphofructokinase [Clostridia bacterium]|nr:6-phosphofructokinase [Clostridia bacterium]
MKTIGVLTSGGDAPGMNAAIRAVVRTARENDMDVYAIYRGYQGLMEDDMKLFDVRDVSDIIQRGGTILYSARSTGFNSPEGVAKAVEVCRNRGIEGLVVIGGDGTFRGARDLSNAGIPCIGVTGTIDNDIASTDYTVGFDTALNTVKDMVDRLRDTVESHSRCIVVEVMGRTCGYLALYGGIATGATCILIPERKLDLDRDVIEVMRRTQKTGKKHFVIMVAEGVVPMLKEQGIDDIGGLAKFIQSKTGVESRSIDLGHCQRGGSPTVRDRITASMTGNRAVHLLLEGMSNRVVVMQKGSVVDYDITEAVDHMTKEIDLDLYRLAMEISI